MNCYTDHTSVSCYFPFDQFSCTHLCEPLHIPAVFFNGGERREEAIIK